MSEPSGESALIEPYERSFLNIEQSPEKWRAALSILPYSHPLQSWAWGDFKSRWGWSSTHMLLEVLDDPTDAPPLGAALVLKRDIPRTRLSILYVPKGPALDYKDRALRRVMLAQLEQLAHREKAIFVKIDPDVIRAWGEDDSRKSPIGSKFIEELTDRGWRFSQDQIQFKNTVELDLELDEESLLKAMKQKTRYNIRLAERKEVKIRRGTSEDFPAIADLYQETSARDGFTIRPKAY
ncbi:MAG: lipid II:glycine glycyltransferase FemX [Candidatus Promineifilaceae bacterium]